MGLHVQEGFVGTVAPGFRRSSRVVEGGKPTDFCVLRMRALCRSIVLWHDDTWVLI